MLESFYYSMSPYMAGITASYAILFIGALSPGPSVALLVGIASSQGRAPALVTTAGIASGSATINILTLLGVGLLLSQIAWTSSVLRIIGAAYLLYLALGAFRKALTPPPLIVNSTDSEGLHKQFLKGYLLQVTNLKAMSFWLSISAIGAVQGAPTLVIVLFVIGSFLVSFTCHGAWALVLSTQKARHLLFSARRWVECALGGLFVFFAYHLVSTR